MNDGEMLSFAFIRSVSAYKTTARDSTGARRRARCRVFARFRFLATSSYVTRSLYILILFSVYRFTNIRTCIKYTLDWFPNFPRIIFLRVQNCVEFFVSAAERDR